MNKSDFYTLKGYSIKNNDTITIAMEDYLEMIYRNTLENEFITIKNLAHLLNVKPSSVSKMCNKLNSLNLVDFQKYGHVSLTPLGKTKGEYLLLRHNMVEKLLKLINGDDFKLEQVEKLEHFVDEITLNNLMIYLSTEKKFTNK